MEYRSIEFGIKSAAWRIMIHGSIPQSDLRKSATNKLNGSFRTKLGPEYPQAEADECSVPQWGVVSQGCRCGEHRKACWPKQLSLAQSLL
jgi:hypothetical protein